MKDSINIKFNDENYIASYNPDSKYYEANINAPSKGGIYKANINFEDLLGNIYDDTKHIQIWKKENTVIETNKIFMWIFDFKDFKVKDIVEISDRQITIDEETNANTIITILKKTKAKAKDIVFIKKNNEIIYWGVVKDNQNENGKLLYEYTLKYITNMFDQDVILKNEELIKTTGVEDFIAKTITDNFISNTDTFENRKYLEIEVKTHTKKQTKVSNVNNNIYNLHTWMTNCTQSYNIVYSFSIKNKKLVLTIENKVYDKIIIDTKAHSISNYTEVFETDIVSKVVVLTKEEGEFILYLKIDRTTTTDKNDINRADGKTVTVYTEKYEDAEQMALDTIRANRYNHNITFEFGEYIKIGTPVVIKTPNSLIYDTYISSVRITSKESYEYICGNIRIKFIDQLLKERRK